MSKKIYVIEASKLDERILNLESIDTTVLSDTSHYEIKLEIKVLKELKQSAKAIIIPTDEQVKRMAKNANAYAYFGFGEKHEVFNDGFTAGAKSIIKQLTTK